MADALFFGTCFLLLAICFWSIQPSLATNFPSNQNQAQLTEALRLERADYVGLALGVKGGRRSLGAARRQDLVHRRRLLGSAQTATHGSISSGYYYVSIMLGTPPQQFALILDTGSSSTYVPCHGCRHCGHHQDPWFRPANSSTFHALSCDDDQCLSPRCNAGEKCVYSGAYAEGSRSAGIVSRDLVTFLGNTSLDPTPVVFGCELRETGDLYSQQADGILGLGRGALSIVSQLASRGIIQDSFSLCYGTASTNLAIDNNPDNDADSPDDANGALFLGSPVPPPSDMVFAPMDDLLVMSPYYVLDVLGLRLGGHALSVPAGTYGRGYGNVVDSGTTFSYFPTDVYQALVAELTTQVTLPPVPGPDPKYHDTCFGAAGDDPAGLQSHFPGLRFEFGGGAALDLTPESYLFHHKKTPGAWCLGIFQNLDPGMLIGGITTRNLLVYYDRSASRVGFAHRNCSALTPRGFPRPQTLDELAEAGALQRRSKRAGKAASAGQWHLVSQGDEEEDEEEDDESERQSTLSFWQGLFITVLAVAAVLGIAAGALIGWQWHRARRRDQASEEELGELNIGGARVNDSDVVLDRMETIKL